MPQDHVFDASMRLHRGLPRQGPGSEQSTLELLRAALDSRPDDAAPVRLVYDAGAGSGAASLLLARELSRSGPDSGSGSGGPDSNGRGAGSADSGSADPSGSGATPHGDDAEGRDDVVILAVDAHAPFLEELAERAAADGWESVIRTEHRSMVDPELLERLHGAADLIWCEAAVHSVGLHEALTAWRPLLSEHGRVVLTEFEWTAEPSAEAAKYWNARRPLNDHERNEKIAAEAGYRVIHHAPLPESDWWDEYYTLLAQRAEQADLRDPAMIEAVRGLQHEIAIRQDYGEDFAAVGYVLAPQ